MKHRRPGPGSALTGPGPPPAPLPSPPLLLSVAAEESEGRRGSSGSRGGRRLLAHLSLGVAGLLVVTDVVGRHRGCLVTAAVTLKPDSP